MRRPVRDAILNTLKDLHLARAALAKDRTAAKNRARAITVALLWQHNAARLKQIDQRLAAIDRAIIDQISADPAPDARRAILISIPGIAAVSAAMRVVEMPEPGSLDPTSQALSCR